MILDGTLPPIDRIAADRHPPPATRPGSTMTSTPPVTALAETGALYAALNEDEVHARSIVAGILPSERATFTGRLDTLRSMPTDQIGNSLTDWPTDVERVTN